MPRISSNILAFRLAIATREGADIGVILRATEAPAGLMEGDPPYVNLLTGRRIRSVIVEATGGEDTGQTHKRSR